MRQKLQVKVIVLSVWTVGVVLIAHSLRDVIGGQFKEYWFIITALVVVVGTGFIEFLRWVARLAKADGDDTQETAPYNGALVGRDGNALQGRPAMADNPKVIIQSPGVVNIHNNTTNNNVQGGIVGSGTVNVHQHFENPQPSAPPSESRSLEPVELIPEGETATIEQLRALAETLLDKGISDGTIRNILLRADVESCGEESSKARAKLYPKEQAEKAIADYAVAQKKR